MKDLGARAARRVLQHFEEDVAAFFMAALLVVLTLQVVTRVLHDPFYWTEEVARHLFIVMVFFGASGAIRDRAHISIDIFVTFLPARARLAVALACNGLVLFFLANIVYWGIRATGRIWDIPTTTLEMPTGVLYLVVPVTGVLMVLRTLGQMREDIALGDPARAAPRLPTVD